MKIAKTEHCLSHLSFKLTHITGIIYGGWNKRFASMITFLLWATIVGMFTGLVGLFMFFHTSDKSGTGKDLISIGMGLAGICAIGLLWMRTFS